MKKILVTGSSGQLGQEVVRQLREYGYQATGLDTLPADTTDLLVDICDAEAIGNVLQGMDAVVHSAAIHGKHYALGYPREAFIDTNIGGTFNLLRACVQHGVGKFLYISTTSIYGHALVNPAQAVWVDETLEPDPRDIYDITKRTSEWLCRDFFEKENLETAVLRVSRFLPESANLRAVHRLYRGLDERDGAQAVRLALEKRFRSFEVYNISNQSPFQPEDLPALLYDPRSVILRHYPWAADAFREKGWDFPAKIDRVYAIGKAKAELGYAPVYNFAALLGR
jgi:nucleoside-diphosphate-sugar epimerase